MIFGNERDKGWMIVEPGRLRERKEKMGMAFKPAEKADFEGITELGMPF